MAFILNERFDGKSYDDKLDWYCEPENWFLDEALGRLVIHTADRTDYWQKTGYGFRADNGHLLCTEVGGDFVMTTRVLFRPVNQYDQAGLMVRLSETCWLKTSVEYEHDGPAKLGTVVTNNGYSDWAVQDFLAGLNEVTLRIKRTGSDYTVEYLDGEIWKLLRLTHLMEDYGENVKAGIYACSPKKEGFVAEFEYLTIEE